MAWWTLEVPIQTVKSTKHGSSGEIGVEYSNACRSGNFQNTTRKILRLRLSAN
jgi:hypothetical protein